MSYKECLESELLMDGSMQDVFSLGNILDGHEYKFWSDFYKKSMEYSRTGFISTQNPTQFFVDYIPRIPWASAQVVV